MKGLISAERLDEIDALLSKLVADRPQVELFQKGKTRFSHRKDLHDLEPTCDHTEKSLSRSQNRSRSNEQLWHRLQVPSRSRKATRKTWLPKTC